MVNNNMLNDSSIGSIGDIGNAGNNASEGRYRLNILDRNSNSGCSKLTVVDLHIIAGTVNSIRSIDEVYSPRRQYNTIRYKAIQGNTVYAKKSARTHQEMR